VGKPVGLGVGEPVGMLVGLWVGMVTKIGIVVGLCVGESVFVQNPQVTGHFSRMSLAICKTNAETETLSP